MTNGMRLVMLREPYSNPSSTGERPSPECCAECARKGRWDRSGVGGGVCCAVCAVGVRQGVKAA